jgi:hypothetical protein
MRQLKKLKTEMLAGHANVSVLKIGMKNAVLRRQGALSAQPAPKRRARQVSAVHVQLHGGKRREQQQPKL